MSVTIAYSDNQQEATLHIKGKFDFDKVQDFRKAYSEVPKTVKRFVVDMRDSDYMDSSGLGMLLNMRKHLGGDGADIRITNCKPQVKKILLISRFDKKFKLV